jgi:WD40 repeat protein
MKWIYNKTIPGRSVVCDKTGSVIVTASENGTVHLYLNSDLVHTIQLAPSNKSLTLATKNGETIFVALDNTLYVLAVDNASLHVIQTMPQRGSIAAIACTHNNAQCAVIIEHELYIFSYIQNAYTVSHIIKSHDNNWFNAVTFNDDGTLLIAVTSQDLVIYAYNNGTWQQQSNVAYDIYWSVTCSKDASIIIAGTDIATADVCMQADSSWRCITLGDREGGLNGTYAACNEDASIIAVGCENATLKIYVQSAGKWELHTVFDVQEPVNSVACNKDASIICVGLRESTQIFKRISDD